MNKKQKITLIGLICLTLGFLAFLQWDQGLHGNPSEEINYTHSDSLATGLGTGSINKQDTTFIDTTFKHKHYIQDEVDRSYDSINKRFGPTKVGGVLIFD